MKYSKKIIQVLSEVLIIPVKNLSSETNSENEPKWDSIAHVRVILEIEKKFKIKIDTKYSFINNLDFILPNFILFIPINYFW